MGDRESTKAMHSMARTTESRGREPHSALAGQSQERETHAHAKTPDAHMKQRSCVAACPLYPELHRDFWTRPDGGKVCQWCHPKPVDTRPKL